MSNPSKQKGTTAESAVVGYLREHGFVHAERRALHGGQDLGDITGIPGLCVEVKAAARLEIPAWLRETAAETVNSKADYGVLVVKPKGVGVVNVGNWWAVQPLSSWVESMRWLGYGQKP